MTDISVYVLKPFPFSRNGIKEEQAELNATINIPDRLFDALNREGYVRRSDIGDGHVSLRVDAPPVADAATAPAVVEAAEANGGPAQVIVAIEGPAERVQANLMTDTIRNVVNAAKSFAGVTKPAPSPASATAELAEDELAALTDGSWKEWRFFKQRSVAAKLSDKPIKEGADAKAAIEAFIASKGL